jgi:hypothetical protein
MKTVLFWQMFTDVSEESAVTFFRPVFVNSSFLILAGTSALLADVLLGFPQSIQANTKKAPP